MEQGQSTLSAPSISDLRKKELFSPLTAAEQQELDRQQAIENESYPNRTTIQYADKVRLTAFRNFTIREVTPKVTFIQKMFKQDISTEYRLQILNELEDVGEYMFSYAFGLEMRQFMDKVGLGLEWPKMLPVDDGMTYTDPLEEDDKLWFESFPEPAWCAAKLRETEGLESAAEAHGKLMAETIQWLRWHWENGFNIYADIDPWEVDEFD